MLLLLLQRSPFLTQASTIRALLSKPLVQIARAGLPLGTYFAGTHAVTGATGVVPAGNSVNPAEATVGEQFTWAFRVTGETAHDYSVSGLPAGILQSPSVLSGGVSSISGIPEEAGAFTVVIIGWEHEGLRGDATAPYELTLNIGGGEPPSILIQPLGGQHDVGADARIEVEANGSGLHYRWRKDGEEIMSSSKKVVAIEDAKRVLIPTEDLSDTWKTDPHFDDSTWQEGTGGVGYERSNNGTYDDYISNDVEEALFGQQTSALIRIPFELTADDLLRANQLLLRIQFDDGFAAYLNGTRVAAVNAPGEPFMNWNSEATDGHDDTLAVTFEEWDLREHLSLLKEGTNLLAIHGLNDGANSSDFLISAEMIAGRDLDMPVLDLANVQPSDAGSYTVEVHNATGQVLSEAAILEVAGEPAETFDFWRAEHWSEDPTVAAAQPEADPDHDGLTNLFEFYLRTSPMDANSAKRPHVDIALDEEQPMLVLQFPLGREEAVDVSFEHASLADAVTWEPLRDGVDGVQIEQSKDMRILRLPLSLPRRFVRIHLALPE